MTLEALERAIEFLVVKRNAAHGNEAEQAHYNSKLSKLYDCKYLMLAQAQR